MWGAAEGQYLSEAQGAAGIARVTSIGGKNTAKDAASTPRKSPAPKRLKKANTSKRGTLVAPPSRSRRKSILNGNALAVGGAKKRRRSVSASKAASDMAAAAVHYKQPTQQPEMQKLAQRMAQGVALQRATAHGFFQEVIYENAKDSSMACSYALQLLLVRLEFSNKASSATRFQPQPFLQVQLQEQCAFSRNLSQAVSLDIASASRHTNNTMKQHLLAACHGSTQCYLPSAS